jgi:hypothetical protein
MLGGLRAEKVGNEVKVFDGIHFLWRVFPVSERTARRWGTVAGMLDGSGRCQPLDIHGTRLRTILDNDRFFLGYEPGEPIGEFGWLLDLVQEAGLVLNVTEAVKP